MRIGIVARIDKGGLANMTDDFWKHIPEITKQLVIPANNVEDDFNLYLKGIICNGFPTLDKIDKFLKDIDIVLMFETPYNWNIISLAEKRGIKTVLIPNYEWSNPNPPIHPDLYLCPSLLDKDIYKKKHKSKYLPIPVDRKLIPFKLRKKARTFIFNNGHGGTGGRNGVQALLEAIPMVKAKDIKFIIRSQVNLPPIDDDRVEIKLGSITKKADLFKEGDVFLFPHMFDGLSLPIQEALSAGMPVISTNFYPHNIYMPKEWFFEADGFKKGRVAEIAREIDVAIINPEKLAEKIDEWAGKDITKDSKRANEIAEEISWDNLYEEYIKVFKELL